MKYYYDNVVWLVSEIIEAAKHDELEMRRRGKYDPEVHSFINGEKFEHYLRLCGVGDELFEKYRHGFWSKIDKLCELSA